MRNRVAGTVDSKVSTSSSTGSLVGTDVAAGRTPDTAGVDWISGDGNAVTPTSLTNATDGNDATAAGEGFLGAGTSPYIKLDLGTLAGYEIRVKMGIRLKPGFSGNGSWFLNGSADNTFFQTVWSLTASVSNTERVIYFRTFFEGRYLRLGCIDQGAGPVGLKLYSINAFLRS